MTAQLTAQIFDLGSNEGEMAFAHTEALDRSAGALAVIRMTAPQNVVDAANAYQGSMLDWSKSRADVSFEAARAREAFEKAARDDLLPRGRWNRLVS